MPYIEIGPVNKYQKTNTFDTLRSVVLGTYFMPEYFRSIKNDRVREPLMRMAQEINEDLYAFESILKLAGCQVLRAEQPTGEFDVDNPYVSPLHVRNNHCVIGNAMYQLNEDFYNPLTPVLENYCPGVVNLVDANNKFYDLSMALAQQNYNKEKDLWYSASKYAELAGSSWPKYQDYVAGTRSNDVAIQDEMSSFATALEYETKELAPLQGPNVINTDHTIYVDANEYCNYAQWLAPYVTDSRPIKQFTSKAAHVDGCFAVLGNNVVLGIDPFIDYEQYFPEHRVVRVSGASYLDQIAEFISMREKVNGAWWLPGEENNNEFISYVNQYLKSWTGYVTESIFDVNVLALSKETIFVSNVTPEVRKDLSSAGIECIVVPWRHRFFVDGGLHCITLDLYRDN
jgi:hypothetical protein